MRGSHRIIHAGDIGAPEIIAQLAKIAPVTAVRGNIDKDAWARNLPETDVLELDGITVYVLHDLAQFRSQAQGRRVCSCGRRPQSYSETRDAGWSAVFQSRQRRSTTIQTSGEPRQVSFGRWSRAGRDYDSDDRPLATDSPPIATIARMSIEFHVDARAGAARAGRLITPHGQIETPVFMPVGTAGTVKAVPQDVLEELGVKILLGNTYHLYQRRRRNRSQLRRLATRWTTTCSPRWPAISRTARSRARSSLAAAGGSSTSGKAWSGSSTPSSNLGLLSRFVGMITDSRSFLSYVRHEYFRRVLCALLGADIEAGLIPADGGPGRAGGEHLLPERRQLFRHEARPVLAGGGEITPSRPRGSAARAARCRASARPAGRGACGRCARAGRPGGTRASGAGRRWLRSPGT